MIQFTTQLRNKFCDTNSSKNLLKLVFWINLCKKHYCSVQIVHLHSEDVWFQSLPGQQVSWQNFHDFLCYFEANSGVGPQLNKDHFNSNVLQTSFINQPIILFFFCHGGPGPPHCRGFTTPGGTPLEEWPAPFRDLYLTTQHSLQIYIHAPRQNSNPQSQQASGRRTKP